MSGCKHLSLGALTANLTGSPFKLSGPNVPDAGGRFDDDVLCGRDLDQLWECARSARWFPAFLWFLARSDL